MWMPILFGVCVIAIVAWLCCMIWLLKTLIEDIIADFKEDKRNK